MLLKNRSGLKVLRDNVLDGERFELSCRHSLLLLINEVILLQTRWCFNPNEAYDMDHTLKTGGNGGAGTSPNDLAFLIDGQLPFLLEGFDDPDDGLNPKTSHIGDLLPRERQGG